jgi:hypothetical protein
MSQGGRVDVTSWYSTKQYCSSPTSQGKPAGGGEITTFLIAIRAAGIRFFTNVHYHHSEREAHPSAEVSANGEVVVSGGAIDNFIPGGSIGGSLNMLTASYPVFIDPTQITGWKASGKDQHFPSPAIIRACVVTLGAESV